MKFTIFTLSSFALLCLTQAQNTYRPQYPANRASVGSFSADTRAPYDPNSGNRYASPQPAYRPQPATATGSSNAGYGPAPRNYRKPAENAGSNTATRTAEDDAAEAEEEEQKPTRLELLLQQSKFTCSNKNDGYYADSTVKCEVFHYCVGGAKHSWMCPENTVFHQVHLNCVPAAQDICGETDKYSAQVNDYLHKPLEQRGPNNTVLYHQRFYPEEFIGDALLTNTPAIQSFGYAPGTAPQAAPQPQPQPRPQPQPSRPAARPTYNTYDNSNDDDEQPAYRPSVPSRPPTRSQPSYSPYQNVPAPKPAPVPVVSPYKPQNKPISVAPAPQPYLANYRAVSSNQPPRRPEYSSYQPSSNSGYSSAPKPSTYNSYSNNYSPSSSSSSSLPNKPPSGYSIPANIPSYKPTTLNPYSNARAQPYKPTSSAASAASYPVSYSPSVYDSEASSSSAARFGGSVRAGSPLRAAGDGVTYEEEY